MPEILTGITENVILIPLAFFMFLYVCVFVTNPNLDFDTCSTPLT